MRVLAVLLVFAASLGAPALAQDASFRAALSPVQSAVDGAGSLVTSAHYEPTRDGSPDEAFALRAQLDAFTATLSRDWSLPAQATYREQVLAALPYAREVFETVAPLPDNVGSAARLAATCDSRGSLSPAQARLLAQEVETVRAWGELIREVASRSPVGIDVTPLQQAADAVESWTASTKLLECASSVPEPFITLRLIPAKSWPGGTVRAVGSTNMRGDVTLEASALSFSAQVPVTRGAFSMPVPIPRETSFGTIPVTAAIGDVSATAMLEIVKAPSRIVLDGPSSVVPGAAFSIRARLISPLPDITDSATLTISGSGGGSVALARGAGTFPARAPDLPQRLTYTFTYAGTAIVAGAVETFTIEVRTPETPAPTPPLPGGSPPTPDPIQPTSPATRPPILGIPPAQWRSLASANWLWLLLAAILAVLVAIIVAIRRFWPSAKGAIGGAPVARSAPPISAAAAGITWVGRGIIAAFVALVHLLTRRGDVTPAMTAREVSARIEAKGVPVEGVVEAFERVRYGSKPEAATWADRMRTWAQDTWRRLGGES